MRKLTSVFLALTMLLTSAPMSTFAMESEYTGEYNSLKLPVINEVRDENTDDIAPYRMQSASLMSEQSGVSIGCGGGNTGSGGGGKTNIFVSPAYDTVLAIESIGEQTAGKGGMLAIENLEGILPERDAEAVNSFYDKYYISSAVIEYEKDGETSLLYYNDHVFRHSYDDDTNMLSVPVPEDLENGRYNVKVHQLNSNTWEYKNGEYSELVFKFALNVTDAEEPIEEPVKLNEIKALRDTASSMNEGNLRDRPTFRFSQALPEDAKMTGFALCDNGNVYPISGDSDGDVIVCNDEVIELPAGSYDCYFYIVSPSYVYDELPNELYGPVKLDISGIWFENDNYCCTSARVQRVQIGVGYSAAKRVPENVRLDNCTLSLNFKDANGNIVHTMSGIELEDAYFGNGNGGSLYFQLSLVGFAAGSYYTDVILNDESGNPYKLGEAVLNITDKTIIDYASILNYNGTLTTATESFYVLIETTNMFLDCDKININLLDKGGNVVAKTVSKELSTVSSYGSSLIYKLKVTGTLDTRESYTLDIQSAPELELVSTVNDVYIRVTEAAKVIRAELVGTNTVRFYTENIMPGEYLVTDSNSGAVYNTAIDEQGVGTFNIDNIESTYYELCLCNLNKEPIRSFSVQAETDGYFTSKPEFIAAGARKIENFYVRALSQMERPAVEGIEYARITQNGEVIAKMSNLRVTDWSYYGGETGSRIELYGDLTVEDGKAFNKGNAVFEIKYTDGFIYTEKLVVTDEKTGLYGTLKVDNSCNVYKSIDGMYFAYAVGNKNASFTIDSTNAKEGTVSLYEEKEVLETLNLSSLDKTVGNGFYYTYKGAFNTELTSGRRYRIVFEANDEEKRVDDFAYYAGKMTRQSSDLTASNGNGDISLDGWINIPDIKALTFKAVVGENTYNVPVTVSWEGDDDYIHFDADFSSVPAGYFRLKAFDGSEEVNLTDTTIGYNFGNISKPVTRSTGWHWNDANKDIREFCVYGANLDKVENAVVKVYKKVDFPEGTGYRNTKMQYVRDITLPKPYMQNYIAVNNDLITDLETGLYVFVYVLDGVASASDDIYIKGHEPAYKASAVLNGGIGFTNKDNAELTVSTSGYSKLRVAFSKAELETKAYEPITASKNIAFGDKNGLITVYIQFANDDESKTEIIETSITVDTKAPTLENVDIPELGLWSSTEITFTTDELLRNAFLIVGQENAETGVVEGRNYTFAYVGTNDGKYTYKCNLYADSKYENIDSVKAQIAAYDKAGNEARTAAAALSIIRPRNISGTVTYNGRGVNDACVYLRDKNNNYHTYTYTDDEGRYVFAGIVKGDYTIEVNSRFYNMAELTVGAAEFGADITGKDIALTSAFSDESALKVSVKDYNDTAVAGAYVSVYCWDTGIDLVGRTDANGEVTFTVPYKNGGTTYRIYANHNDYSESEYISINRAAANIEINLPQKATISGVALKGETPVSDTEVTITGDSYTTYAKTDDEGRFTADVYIVDGSKRFVVSVRDNTRYSGSAEVVFGEELTADVTLNLTANIRIKGTIRDNLGQTVNDAYSSIYFVGNGVYLTVTPDANGEFETPDVFSTGTYNVSSYGSWLYENIRETVEITDEDLSSAIKELNITVQKRAAESKFTTGENKITASADVIAKGDTATVNVKFQNDGTATLSNVTAYANIPAGVDVKSTNGTKNDNGTVSKTAGTLKADETGSLTFTVGTENYDGKAIIIPAYVMVGNKKYPIGAVTIEIASVTLSAPQVVKKDTAFKVSGEAISGSTVEILNYATKEVLAATDLTSKWYFADISGISEETTLVAKVTKDGKTAYSDIAVVKVEENPIAVRDVKIKWGYILSEFGVNEDFGYPTLSIWEGYDFSISTKFDNMPDGATVKYSFINKKNVPAAKDGDDYYNATIRDWSGYGTKKVIATVTDGDKEYEFIVAELVILIDPSGYITDAETGEPIAGANVLLEVKSGNDWITWDAAPHLQQNPMLTDDEGHYGWMVPEGEYRIIVTASGYETKTVEKYNSRDYGDNSSITVLPVRTDVDIALVNSRAVEVDETSTASIAGGRVKFVFTRPVDPATINAENIKVLNSDGTTADGTVTLAENNTVALFKPTAAMENGSYKLAVANIKDGSGNTITAEEIAFEKTADAPALAAPAVTYNTDGTVTITFADGKVPVNIEEIAVKNGDTVVNGTFRKTENVITFIPDTAFTAGTTYKVTVSDAIRTDANEYPAAAVDKTVTIPGGSTPVNPGSPAGGGGGGSSSAAVAMPTVSVPAGEVEAGTKVELKTTTKDAVIYYTTDGTEPTEKSTLYKEAITVNEAITIKAVAVKNKTKSSVLTAKYTVKKAEENPTEKAPAFADIASYAWAENAIAVLTEKGIIKGVSDTEFAPANDIKRADFMLLLVRMLNLKADVTDNFDDVASDKYYYEGIGIAKALGLTTGVGDNKFAPEASITRQDMFVLAYRILQMQKAELIAADESAISTFADYASIAGYAKEGLAALVKNELVRGSENKINPIGNATRAETAVFIYGLYSLLNK